MQDGPRYQPAVGEDVDRDCSPALNGESEQREGLPAVEGDDPRCSIYQCWPNRRGEAAELERTAGCASQLGHALAMVVADDDVGIEHGDKRVEIAVTRRGEERVDDCALRLNVCVGCRCSVLHTPSRPARQLACCLR